MDHPVIVQANVQARYDGMLEAANMYRRIKRLPRQDLGLRACVRHTGRDALITLSERLKVQRSADAEMAVLNE